MVNKHDKTESSELTLKKALSEGLVIEKEKVSEMIDKALKENEERLKKEMINSLSIEKNKLDDAQLEDYLRKSNLTNKEFAKELRLLNISAYEASFLRDDNFNMKIGEKLDGKRLWGIIRQNYKPIKK